MKRNIKSKFNFNKFFKFFISIGSSSISQIFVLVIVLIILNLFSQKYFLRFDITQSNKYTLDKATKTTIDQVDDTVTLKIFFSDNIPLDLKVTSESPELAKVPDDIKDIYDEYARFSKGKVKVEVKNPGNNEDDKSEALDLGIPELQYGAFSNEGDTYEVAKGFLGVGIYYKDKKEALSVITNTNTLEYDTTLAIRKMLIDQKPKIGFLTGHGEKSLYSDYTQINGVLENQFSIESISTSTGKPISSDITVLVIAAPSQELTERDKFEIDQYIMNGGKVLFLVDAYEVDYTTQEAMKTQTNLKSFIEGYGITYDDTGMVLDETYRPFMAQGIFPIEYPFWVRATKDNFNQDNPTLASLESIVVNWATTLDFKDSKEGRENIYLIQTSRKAWINVGDSIYIGLDQNWIPQNQKRYTLSLAVSGKQDSQFAGQPIPTVENDERTDQTQKDSIDNSLIVAIGDSDFISDTFISDNEGSGSYFVNLLDWMGSGEDLISIRSKGITERPLETLSDAGKNIVKVLNIITLPIIIAGFGIAYNIYRNKRRRLI